MNYYSNVPKYKSPIHLKRTVVNPYNTTAKLYKNSLSGNPLEDNPALVGIGVVLIGGLFAYGFYMNHQKMTAQNRAMDSYSQGMSEYNRKIASGTAQNIQAPIPPQITNISQNTYS
jgi:hypothetical protein